MKESRGRVRPKKNLSDAIMGDLRECGVSEEIMVDMWREKVSDSTRVG